MYCRLKLKFKVEGIAHFMNVKYDNILMLVSF